MVAGGIVMIVIGVINLVFGIVVNTNELIQVASFFALGTTHPGTFNIVIGSLLLIGGIILLVCGIDRNKKKKEAQLRLMQEMSRPVTAAAYTPPAAPSYPAATAPAYTAEPAPTVPSVPYTQFRLQCVAGAFAGKRFPIEGKLVMGRDSGKCALVFPAHTHGISGVHCQLEVLDGSVWIKDLGSTYGTFLEGGKRLAASQAQRLTMGTKFWLGSENEVFMITPKGGL